MESNMQNSYTTSLAKKDFHKFLIRIGKIFSNISILALVFCFCGVISFAATAFILIFGLIAIILSLGIIFLYVPNFFDILMSAAEVSSQISTFFLNYFFIFAAIAIITSIVSLILLVTDKQTKHVARIVISSIVIAIVLIIIIVVLTRGV